LKKFVFLFLAAAVAAMAAGCGQEETEEASYYESEYGLDGVSGTYTLTVQTHDPSYAVSGVFLADWAESIEQASGGHIEIEINYGASQGGAGDTAYMVRNGICDIGWGMQKDYSGWFPATEVFSLPFLGIGSAEQGSAALWEFWETTGYMDEEYAGYHVLLLHTGCQSPYAVVEGSYGIELNGHTVSVDTSPMTSFVQKLDALPLDVSNKVLYDDFEDKTVDGCIKSWDMLDFLSMDAVISGYMDEDFGVNTYFLLMNQESYDGLPEALQQVIDEKSEEALQYVYLWDDAEAEAKAAVSGKIYQSQDRVAMEEAAAQAAEEWVSDMCDNGYDGQGIYEAALQCIREAEE